MGNYDALRARNIWPEPTSEMPSMDEIEAMVFDLQMPEATDGCTIEPDGICCHGHPSWLIVMGII